jgi:putative CocE/NonD family hydrolase
VTGHPVIHLWVTSTAKDGDFFVYLEEAHRSGYSQYVTEGVLRASHRALSAAPFKYLNLPYHRSYQQDMAALPGQPVELVFDLLPTSNLFEAGNRIRVTVTCADRDNARSPALSPPPTVSLYRTAKYSSHLILPVIPTPADAATPADLHPVASTDAGGGGWPIGLVILALSVSAVAFTALSLKFFKRPS